MSTTLLQQAQAKWAGHVVEVRQSTAETAALWRTVSEQVLSCKESLTDLGAGINVNTLESRSLDRPTKRRYPPPPHPPFPKKIVQRVAFDRKENLAQSTGKNKKQQQQQQQIHASQKSPTPHHLSNGPSE